VALTSSRTEPRDGGGLGYQGRLYILAFDHRGSFRRDLFGISGEPDARQTAAIADAKRIVFDGLARAADSERIDPGTVGVLVDEQFGAEVARLATARGFVLSMPAERSDQELFEFEYGDRFGEHIESFDPDLTKVLVRYNPDGDPDANAIQLERLRHLADWLHDSGRSFLYELLVPPTSEQLASVGDDRERYEIVVRPELIGRGIAAAQQAGVEVDVWKLEGVDRAEDARALVRQARSGPGHERVACMVLGAGAGEERVVRWLRVAAATDGFCGFAIGRSIWRAPLEAHLRGQLSREAAVEKIAGSYLAYVDAYERASEPATPGP
jgi:myo-inositol catabolism protein IolC